MRYFVLGTVLALGSPVAAQDSPPQEDPAAISKSLAIDALDRMAAHLRSLDSFEVNAEVVAEEVFTNGEKLQFLNHVRYVVDRPGKLYVSLRSDRKYRRVYFDGQNLTITAPTTGYYTSTPMTGTIRELLDQASDKYGIEIPLDNLFRWGTEDADMPVPSDALLIGFSQIDDHPTDHYFFRAEGVDWQVWIGREDNLPHRLVITNTEDEAQPVYAANLDWTLAPEPSASQFTFLPTENDKFVQLRPEQVAAAQ